MGACPESMRHGGQSPDDTRRFLTAPALRSESIWLSKAADGDESGVFSWQGRDRPHPRSLGARDDMEGELGYSRTNDTREGPSSQGPLAATGMEKTDKGVGPCYHYLLG